MFRLPPPKSFEDGQRSFFGAAVAAAGIFCAFAATGAMLIFWKGGWTVATEPQRLTAILLIAMGFVISNLIVIVSLSLGGPVGRMKVTASKDSVSIDADGKGEVTAPDPAT